MYIVTSLLFCLNLGIALASNCGDISGVWQNQLGSNMTVVYRSQNQITGEYSTAVESRHRAALVTSNLTGLYMPVRDGGLVSFSVLFNHGKSLTTWVGQCMVCDGEEILFTNWNLRTHLVKPVDRWMSVRISEDTFKRVKGDISNIVPFHFRTLGPSRKDDISATCEKNIKAGVSGRWVSDKNDVLRFADCYESGVFSGKHHDNLIFGRNAGGGPFTALGFVSASNENIKGWTGHIHENPTEKRKIETFWISHSFSDSCKEPRRLAHFGIDNYLFSYGNEETKVAQETSWRRFLNYFTSIFK